MELVKGSTSKVEPNFFKQSGSNSLSHVICPPFSLQKMNQVFLLAFGQVKLYQFTSIKLLKNFPSEN